ncbi:six-hairpin glycosidase [Tamlana nanhaiensis]|uniref:Six-hairpin glycosidase n=1 Tax=Neotamlana nanhaiensis TaxID=1382798 RepID=A0A0D7W7X8_9FLAO|nr:exo-alpha-sialidase [Tamlana nanhaiensis]KJD34778.1 six-hairpin glycosidase [Tamlana nanhaiensis]
MKLGFKSILITQLLCVVSVLNAQQDTIKYVGKTLSNVDYHHGMLEPAVGVHATQIMRASREHPEKADGYGWTYNHAPNIAYWNDTFFIQYLSDPVGEHIPPSQTFMLTSKDGEKWSFPQVTFPIYSIPDGFVKEGVEGVAKNLKATMHQRMGFFTSSDNRFFTLAFYGISMHEKDSPNDGNGIGRVIREIYKDGSLGAIYFIRYNHGWNEKNTNYPFYKSSKDRGFKKACEELMAQPLLMQQWVEEADRDDPLIPLQKQYKAFSFYDIPDGRTVGLWKHALTSMSNDGGKTWQYDPLRAPGFVNSNAKIWGQKTTDGKYATVYNPSEFRWPLAVSTSNDGLNYDNLFLVHGELSRIRYGGAYKSHGPQYVRGITPNNGTPKDGNMWLTYSVNKEDIWVASVPVPVTNTVSEHANDVFTNMPDGEELKLWNTYDLQWATANIEAKNGEKWLTLRDQDPFDYSRVERVIPFSEKLEVTFTVKPEQNNHGMLQIELQNAQGLPSVRLIFDEAGNIKQKMGYRLRNIMPYDAGKEYQITLSVDASTRLYDIKINDEKEVKGIFFMPTDGISRIMFRTGEQRYYPNVDTPVDTPNYDDVPFTGASIREAVFNIKSLITKKL